MTHLKPISKQAKGAEDVQAVTGLVGVVLDFVLGLLTLPKEAA